MENVQDYSEKSYRGRRQKLSRAEVLIRYTEGKLRHQVLASKKSAIAYLKRLENSSRKTKAK